MPALVKDVGEPLHVGGDFTRGLADRKTVAIDMAITPGASISVAGYTMQPMARSAPSSRTAAAGIDGFQRRILVGAAVLVKVPVGDAIHRGDDAGIAARAAAASVRARGDGVRLQADDDEILRSELGGIIGAARMHHTLLIPDQKF